MPYWRVGWLDDLCDLIRMATEQWPSVARHPVTHLLLSDVALAAGDRAEAGEHARRAANAPVAFIAPARWEDAVLIRRGIELLDGEAGSLRYLGALFDAESDRIDAAVQSLKHFVGSDAPKTQVRLAAKVLADWAAHVAHDNDLAMAHLEQAWQAGSPDLRLMLELDQRLFDEHDAERRRALFEQTPAAFRPRGDVTYRLARFAFDQGLPAQALDLLVDQEFSVYEGGADVRRLYVDALLVDALDQVTTGTHAGAVERCKAVCEYPENLGAASYLGEHSRLARFLLGLIASRDGRHEEAESWWRDVVERSAGAVAYVVGGVDKRQFGRRDESLAVALARLRLGEPVDALDDAGRDESASSPDDLCAKLAAAIVSGGDDAVALAERSLAQYPCSALLRILRGLAAAAPLRDGEA